jgi:hypothetical protein
MKKTKLHLLIIAIALLASCAKEPARFDNLPSEVELGKSVVYLNGSEATNYKPEFNYVEVNKVMSYGFSDSVASKINALGFAWLPLNTGDFQLHEERILFVKALTNFYQTNGEDVILSSYDLIDADEGFFNVESLDTVQQIVKGRFEAKFKRSSKIGNRGSGLPKILLFQGVFHEKYVVL